MHNNQSLPTLGDTIKKHNIRAKKSLSQSFILDMNINRKIAHAGGSIVGHNIIEIGAGPGGLTRAILEQNPKHLFAIEKDSRSVNALRELENAYPKKLTVIHADILETKTQNHIRQNAPNARIIANLPYNIATQILINQLSQIPPCYQSMTLMFQKEVAQRITAQHNTKQFGRLSILAQWQCTTTYLFDINPAAFTPKPNITSALVRFEPKKNTHPQPPLATVEEITQAAFSKRRKIIRTTLKKYHKNNPDILAKAGINDNLRPEQIPVKAWIRFANLYQESSDKTMPTLKKNPTLNDEQNHPNQSGENACDAPHIK